MIFTKSVFLKIHHFCVVLSADVNADTSATKGLDGFR